MQYARRTLLLMDAAQRLGSRPVLLAAWHRSPAARALARRALRDAPAPAGPFLPPAIPPALPDLSPALPDLSLDHRAAVLARAGEVAPADWHGPFDPGAPALALDLFRPGDVRTVWERNRWAELPLLAQAARLDPAGGHLDRAEALLADWSRRNPPFRGPNWACGQEASLRALHLALALGLLGALRDLPTGARALLELHGRRIAATPAYALAQDNNHTVSEAAGLFLCGLVLGQIGWTARGAARLRAAQARLIAPCGTFAQLSTGYHRLLLDVLAVAEWLRRALGGPPVLAEERAGAAVRWLHRLVEPGSGATPRLGHQDGSAFADLSLAGPADARPSLERAARLLAGRSAGFGADPGCAWLGLPVSPPLPEPPAAWAGEGLRGWRSGRAWAVLRTGPLRFRPGQADLLHLDLWDGPLNLLRDGGTGAYNPPPGRGWWHTHLSGAAGHNTAEFDGADAMPRLSRFLFARWPRTGSLPDGGAWSRDHRGHRHTRRLCVVEGRTWVVEDSFAGGFATVALRWRLAPAAWRLAGAGVESPLAHLTLTADAPLACALEQGWESPAYGVVVPAPVLVARARAPVSRITTMIHLAS